VRCRATFDPARDLYGAVTQSFRCPVRTERAATAVLLLEEEEAHQLATGVGARGSVTTRQSSRWAMRDRLREGPTTPKSVAHFRRRRGALGDC
jgi:hypothetical protein